MSTPILAQSISRQTVGHALRLMRQECRYEPSEMNALNRAALNLEACTWQYDGEALVIESATTQFQRYHVAYNGCDCTAGSTGRPCWHLAAYRLIQRAAELALTPARSRMSDEAYVRAVAAVDELF